MLELHRFLQDLADDETASGDDIMDITQNTPSDRSTDNIITLLSPYNIDDTLAEKLYDGSISQAGGDTLYSGLRVLGAVNDSNTELQIIQNNAKLTAFWGDQSSGGLNGDAASGILMRCLIKSRDAGSDIDGKRIRVQARHWGDSYDFFNVTLGQGESVAAISTTPDAQNDTLQATVTAYTHVTNTEGFQLIDLNNGNGNREYYSRWTFGADTSGDGLKGMWEFTKDLTGTGTAKTIHGINGELFLGITHSFAYDNEAGGPFQEDETLSWGTGATAGTGLLLALDDDGTTGNFYIQLLTGVAPTDGLQITGGTSSATADVNGTVTARTVPKHFLGSYTGSLIGAYGIGVDPNDLTANDTLKDLSNTDQNPPNNVTFTVSSLVSGEDRVLVAPWDGSSQDAQGNPVPDETQFTGATGSNASGAGTYVVNETIPSDTPASGTVRVHNGESFDRVPYTSYTGSTFTLTGTLPNAAASLEFNYDNEASGPFTLGETLTFGGGGTAELVSLTDDGTTGSMRVRMLTGSNPADNESISGGTSSATADVDGTPTAIGGFVSYIDELAGAASESFTSVYSSDRNLVVRVRDGGVSPIKTFVTSAVLASGGGSVSAIRTTDE